MLDCQRVQRLLDAFVDNELASSEAALCQQHLEACPSCAALSEDLMALKEALRDLPREAAPPHLEARVLERLEAERHGRRGRWRGGRLWPAVALAAAALVALAVLWQGGFIRPGDPMYASMLDDHLRRLSPGAETDMMSKDPQALWRWLNDRASFPVPSTLVSRTGLSLVGGRVAKMEGEEMVSIRYKHDSMEASLYAMAGHPSMPPSARKMMVKGMPLYVDSYRSYNVVMWKEGELLVCALSALNKDSLIDMIVEAHPEKPLEI